MVSLLALGPTDAPPVNIAPEHLDQATMALWLGVATIALFFVVRPELWKKLWHERVDPRGAALARILLGISVLWCWIDLAVLGKFLFTDEGLWLTELARKNYGGHLKELWDPEQGFETWNSILGIFQGRWTVLHFRSDPFFVSIIFGLLYLSSFMMIIGWRTRVATFATWLLVLQLYNYSPIYYTGGDTVFKSMLFLALFCRWGEAYSVDSWLRRKKKILGGAPSLPPLRKIPAWPMRLMIVQLTIIYTATGLLKNGTTWWGGTALYYALNLDHFYRVPTTHFTAAFHYSGFSQASTHLVHWWEMLFPLAPLGIALQRFEHARKNGTWPQAAKWRRWLSYGLFAQLWLIIAFVTGMTASYYYRGKYIGLREDLITQEQAGWIAAGIIAAIPLLCMGIYFGLRKFRKRGFQILLNWGLGKRLWLGIGFTFHALIEIAMNVGTFVQVMIATYPAWLRGYEVDGFWRYLQSEPAKPGENGRPVIPARRRIGRRVLGVVHRLKYRVAPPKYVVVHASDEASIRRAALLRCWDLSHRLEFSCEEGVPPQQLQVRMPGRIETLAGPSAAAALSRVLPGLWLFWPLQRVPGMRGVAARVVGQRAA
jgi:predicted secreted protein